MIIIKYVGKGIEYFTHSGLKRVATVRKIEFHQGLKKPIFIATSPSGNTVRLTKEEINKFI